MKRMKLSRDLVEDTYKSMCMAITHSTIGETDNASGVMEDVLPPELRPFLAVKACRDVAGMSFIAGTVFGIKLERAKRRISEATHRGVFFPENPARLEMSTSHRPPLATLRNPDDGGSTHLASLAVLRHHVTRLFARNSLVT